MLSQRARQDKTKKANYDCNICDALWEIIDHAQYKNIHCYLPMGTEINITPLIEKLLNNNVTVITPKTLPKRKLKNLILKSLQKIEKGVFGTSHPADSTEFTGKYDLIIVPGLAIDHKLFRLGYGGGYYDNFLIQHPEAQTIGIFYPFQQQENIPLENHDIQLDQVLCDESFYTQ